MSMIVARMQKLKAENLTGIGNHNQRKTENHSNKEIDIDRSYLNYDLVDNTQSYKKDIERFINEKKSSPRAIRKDAVLVNEWIISSDRKFFDNLSEGETENFFERVKDYFSENFGEDNIRYATVHLDETTPHMHMGIVPFDKDNKLSAKRVFNRVALQNIQEELPKYLQGFQFEIERGQRGSERKNLTVPEFKEMKNEQEEIERDLKTKKNELLAYTKDRLVTSSLDDLKPEKEMKEVKVPSGEKFLGHEFTKTVKKPTGKLLISKEDFDLIQGLNLYAKKSEGKLLSLLDTDLYKENIELKEDNKEIIRENEELQNSNNKILGSFNRLKEENTFLKNEISDLKNEISLIYKYTKSFLKERTDDLEAFKSSFKELVHDVSEKLNLKGINSYFKKEYDKDNPIKARNKLEFIFEDLKIRSIEKNKANKKEKIRTKINNKSR